MAIDFDGVFASHRSYATDHFADNSEIEIDLVRSRFPAAITLPHREQVAAKTDILLDDLQAPCRAAGIRDHRQVLGFFEFVRE